MSEQAPYEPESENRNWKSKLKDGTRRATRVVGRETGRAIKVAGTAIAREGAKELFTRANESQKRPASLNPERRDAKSTFIDVVTWAGPIAVRAVLADIHNRIMNPSTEQPNGNMGASTPFEAPTQPRPEPGYAPGFETAHGAGHTGFAHSGPRVKV